MTLGPPLSVLRSLELPPGPHFLFPGEDAGVPRLGLGFDRISLSTEMEFIRVGMTVERKCEQKHLVHWGLGLIFLMGLAGKDREVGGRVSLQVCGLGHRGRWLFLEVTVFTSLCWICHESCGHGEEPSYFLPNP